MRALLLQLRPVELKEESLASAIESVVAEIEARGLLTCRTDLDHDIELSPSIAANLLRIFQEAVTNTLRHAQAKSLEVGLYQDEDTILLVIVDDGIGFRSAGGPESQGFLGLTACVERPKSAAARLG